LRTPAAACRREQAAHADDGVQARGRLPEGSVDGKRGDADQHTRTHGRAHVTA